jgi:hypothetical protein
MSNDKPYDFIDPEQYERKQAVQRAVEAKGDQRDPDNLLSQEPLGDAEVEEELEEMNEELEGVKEAEKESGKVGGGSPDSSGIVSRIKTAVGGFFF